MKTDSQRTKLTTTIDRILLKKLKLFAVASGCAVNRIIEPLIEIFLNQFSHADPTKSQEQAAFSWESIGYPDDFPVVKIELGADVYELAKKLAKPLRADPRDVIENLLEFILPLYLDTLSVCPDDAETLGQWLTQCEETLRFAVISQKIDRAFQGIEHSSDHAALLARVDEKDNK